jgi:hypothetical protein
MTDLDMDLIKHIYQQKPLNKNIINKINPILDWDYIKNELLELEYKIE